MMEDSGIVALYWQRDERAIEETEVKFGHYCYTIAYRILQNHEDADESVSDTYIGAWEAMPPHRPAVLSTFLGKITRRISLNRWRSRVAQKRGGGEVPLALEELGECIPSGQSAEGELEQKELTAAINSFLGTLPDAERNVFVSRYWFLASMREISEKYGFTESKVKTLLFRTRKKLRACLEEEELL